MEQQESYSTEGGQPSTQGLQLSVRYGEVWAHWPGMNSNVNLGPLDAVCEEMTRLLAQVDFGEEGQV